MPARSTFAHALDRVRCQFAPSLTRLVAVLALVAAPVAMPLGAQTPPVVTVTPVANTHESSAALTITVTACADMSMTSTQSVFVGTAGYTATGSGNMPRGCGRTTAGTWTAHVTLSPGVNNVSAEVCDVASNCGFGSTTIIYDAPPPTYNIVVTANTAPITMQELTGGSASFTVANNGPTQGTAHIVVSCIGMSGSCSGSKDTVLAAGASAPITAGFTTGSTPTTGSITVTASYLEALSVSSSASTSVTIQPRPPSIAVTLDSAAQVTVGPGSRTLFYTVSNTGGVAYDVSISADCGVFGSCTPLINNSLILGTVHFESGASQDVTIPLSVTAAQQGSLNVPVTLTASGPVTGAASYSVSYPAPLYSIAVTANTPPITTHVATGGTANFSVTNNGPTQGTAHIVVSCIGMSGSCSGSKDTVLAAGASAPITAGFTTGSTATTGSVTVTASYLEASSVSSSASTSVNILPAPASLAVTLDSAAQKTVGPGSWMLYYTVSNTGTDPVDVSLSADCGVFAGCTPLINGAFIVGTVHLVGAASQPVTVQFTVTAAQQGSLNVPVTLTASGSTAGGPGTAAGSYSVTVPAPPPTFRVIVTASQHAVTLSAQQTSGIASFFVQDTSTNLGGQQQTYTLTPSCTGVASCAPIPSVTLSQGARVSVDVPYTVAASGTTGKVVLVAASANTSGADSETVNTTPFYSLAISPATMSQSAQKGSSGQYPVTVKNTSTNGDVSINVSLAVTGCGSPALSGCQAPGQFALAPGVSSAQSVPFQAAQLGVGIIGVTASGTVPTGTVPPVSAVDSVTVTNPPPPAAIAIAPANDNVSSGAPANLSVMFTISSTDASPDTVVYQISCAGGVTACLDGVGKTSGKVGPLSQTGTTSATVAVSYHVNSGAGPIGSVTVRAHGVRDSTLTATGTRIVGVNGVPAIVVNTKAAGPGAAIARDQCVTIAAGADAAYECGDLRLAEGLPATTTMNKARAPMLVYNSRHASPSALIAANVSVNPGSAVTTLVATVSVRNNSSGAFTSTPAVVFPWTAANNASVSSRIVVPVDFTTLGLGSSLTGSYAYTIQVAAKSGATTVATATDTSSVIVVDRTASQFGRGWSLDGLEQLVTANVPKTNVVLWVGGDGNARTYTQKSANSAFWLVTPAIDRTDTLQKIGNNWYRHLRNGSYVEFDNMGHQVATQSPGVFGDSTRSRRTVFHYTSGLLDKITLPVASGTAPAYTLTTVLDANLNMTTLTIDPPSISGVSRETKVFNNPATQRDSVIEADGNMVVFAYDAHGRVTTRIDRLQHATTFDYEPTGGTLADSKLTLTTGDPGTVVHAFCAGEAVGLPSLTGTATPCPTGPVDTGSVRTLYDGPRPDVADTTAFHINRFGEPNTIVDALGAVTRIVRDPTLALLADTIVDPAGHVVAATYNNRGLVVTQTSLAPYGVPGQNAVTRNVWDQTFDKVDTIFGPTGESVVYTYNRMNGDQLTQRDGRAGAAPATFTYNTNRQPATIQRPGNSASQLDVLSYDATLGNLAQTTSPLGQVSSYQRDAIGRVNMVTTPLSGTLTRQQTSRYDVMDRVMATHDIGPAVPYSIGIVSNTAPAMTLSDTNTYDAEGNLLTNIRTSEPDTAFVTPLRLDWTYDDLHRKIGAQDARRRSEAWHYDLAGNDTSWNTRQGKTIITHFDALNRQVVRITPGDTVQAQAVGLQLSLLFPVDTELAKFPYFAPGFTYDPFTNSDATPPDLIIPRDIARFVYDQAGRLDSALDNDARVVRTYFPGGALQTEIQQPAAVDTLETPTSDRYSFHTYRFNYTYDLSGRRKTLTSVLPTCASVCNETYTQTYNYGLQSSLLQQITDVGPRTTSTFTFGYDSANRVIFRAATDTGVAATEGYQYDAAGRLTHRDVTGRAGIPAGGAVYSDDFTYDVANRISSVNVTSSIGALVDQSFQFYNGLGALAAIQRERNGERPIDEYTTDAFGNVRAHTLWKDADHMTTLQSFGAGLLTDIIDSATTNMQSGEGALFLPSIKPIDATTNKFDLSGNLIFSTVTVEDTANNNIVPVVAGRGWTWNAYDPGGHLRVTQQSTWGANALIRTVFIEHRYDALGRQVLVRTRRDLNCIPNAFTGECLQTVEHYAWDGEQQLAEFRSIVVDTVVTDSGRVCVHDDAGCTARAPSFVYTQTGAGGALESDATAGQLFAGMVRYVFADGIDDPLALWKNDGTTFGLVPHRSWRGMYEAGSTIGPTAVNAQWPGRNRDAYFADDARQTPIEQNQWLGGLVDGKRDQSGLMYMRNRYYDPNSGRFTQEDPIGLAGGMNLYGFAGGDPVNFSDPLGLCPECRGDDNGVRERTGFWNRLWSLNESCAAGSNTDCTPTPSIGEVPNVIGGLAGTVNEAEVGADVAIGGYRAVRAAIKGSGLEAHHLIEKRFARLLGANPNAMLSIGLDKAEHQALTNAWRRLIPYGEGTANATIEQVLNAAREIYRDSPTVLKVLRLP